MSIVVLQFISFLPTKISHSTYLSYISSFFSDPQAFEEFSRCIHIPLSKAITLVGSRSDPHYTIDQLREYGYTATPSPYQPSNYTVHLADQWENNHTKSIPLWSTPWHLLWLFYIQETAASIPASIIQIPSDWLILDMCAAPGGKTIQLADRCMISWSSALVWANEPDRKRGKVLRDNLVRCGITNTILTHHDGGRFGEHMPEVFDCILLDAPCSGEGTWFKSTWWTKYRDIRKVQQIAKVQWSLLDSAFKACKPWWQIVYSTCTTNPIENEHTLIKLLETYPGMVSIEEIAIDGLSDWLDDKSLSKNHAKDIQYCKRLRPHIHRTGWFFLVKIRKTWSLPTIKKNTLWVNRPINNHLELIDTASVVKWFHEHRWLSVWPELTSLVFIQQWEFIYGCHPQCSAYLWIYQIDQCGIPLIKWTKPSDRRPLHTSWVLFKWWDDHQILLDDNQILQHLSQQDITIEVEREKESWYYQLIWRDQQVGIGKLVGDTIKNKYIALS